MFAGLIIGKLLWSVSVNSYLWMQMPYEICIKTWYIIGNIFKFFINSLLIWKESYIEKVPIKLSKCPLHGFSVCCELT